MHVFCYAFFQESFYTEKNYSWRNTEKFGNWYEFGYEKNSVDFTEIYSKITRTVLK